MAYDIGRMPFAIIFPRRPVSANRKPNPKFSEDLIQGARVAYPNAPLLGPLYSRVIWFHKSASAQGDVDNIAKRIHDALCGIVYEDDVTISHSLSIRVDASQEVELTTVGSENTTLEDIYEHLANENIRDFIYIEIGPHESRQIHIGPVR